MSKFGEMLEEKIVPVAAKLANNKVLVAIRDGITLAMPLIIIGSLFMVIASFPVKGWEAWLGEVGFANYLWKGARVLFVAIILGVLTAYIYQWFINKDIQIKMPESVPSAVSRSFSAIIPGSVIITMWLVVFALLDTFGLPNLHEVAQVILGKPLGLLGNNIIGTVFVVAFNSLFWFVGIHGGHVVNSIMQPTWIANIDANRVAYQAGEKMTHIITQPFMDNFVYIGGGGATIGLILVLAYYSRKKKASQRTKVMAPITVVPGLFNINEPAMFGIPVVMNLLLFVPFIVAPILNALIAYFAMATNLVPLTRTVASWTMPPILSGFLTTGSIAGALLQVVLIIVDVLLYLPFYTLAEKSFRKEEAGEIQ